MLVLKRLVGLHSTVQLQPLQRYWLAHRLDYSDIEWFALETNRDHSVWSFCLLTSLKKKKKKKQGVTVQTYIISILQQVPYLERRIFKNEDLVLGLALN